MSPCTVTLPNVMLTCAGQPELRDVVATDGPRLTWAAEGLAGVADGFACVAGNVVTWVVEGAASTVLTPVAAAAIVVLAAVVAEPVVLATLVPDEFGGAAPAFATKAPTGSSRPTPTASNDRLNRTFSEARGSEFEVTTDPPVPSRASCSVAFLANLYRRMDPQQRVHHFRVKGELASPDRVIEWSPKVLVQLLIQTFMAFGPTVPSLGRR
jgi:hypothetical protein